MSQDDAVIWKYATELNRHKSVSDATYQAVVDRFGVRAVVELTALVGYYTLVAMTLIGIWHWEPIAARDIPWLLLLCLGAACAHFMLIKAYELAEASSLQPFSYTQLVWVSLFGVTIFGETLAPNVALGGAIVVGAGLFTWWRSRQRARAGLE